MCKVKYPDFDQTIRICLAEGKVCKIARSDVRSAFRNLGMSPKWFPFLVMKAKSPLDGTTYYFIDKCLAFGGSISCSHFQRVSNAIAHLVWYCTAKPLVNYLDDYLYAHLKKLLCNRQVHIFIQICNDIHMPISEEKTFWAMTRMTFLGMLIDTISQTVAVPIEKIEKAMSLIETMLESKKITRKQLEKICGFLNFLCRCVVPGRAFTRCFYSHLKQGLLLHHHIRVDGEMKLDLQTWRTFLMHPTAFSRPFLDFSTIHAATEIDMYSDASRNEKFGLGAICQNSWMIQQWEPGYIEKFQPSIEYLELYSVLVGIMAWIHHFANSRVILFCDNISICYMINQNTSSCRNCMVLIRLLVLYCMKVNVRVFTKHVKTKDNKSADALSRMNIAKFWKVPGNKEKYEEKSTPILKEIWPVSKLWQNK